MHVHVKLGIFTCAFVADSYLTALLNESLRSKGVRDIICSIFSSFLPIKSIQPIGTYVPFWSSGPCLEIEYRSRYETVLMVL